jgi:hypothetical protein
MKCKGDEKKMESRITKEIIQPEEVEQYSNSMFKVQTITPLAEKPIKRTYKLNQEELTRMLKGYETYAEFLISIEVIGDDDIA